MWIYQLLDILGTVTEAVALSLLAFIFLKNPRYKKSISLIVPAIGLLGVTVILTWLTSLGSFKVFLILLYVILVSKCLYRDSILTIFTYTEVWYVIACILPEAVSIGWIFGEDITTVAGGTEVVKWQLYLMVILLRTIMMVLFAILFRNFHYKVSAGDLAVLTIDFLLVAILFILPMYAFLNMNTTEWYRLFAAASVLGFAFMVHFLYFKNTVYLREQKKADEMQIEKLQMQYDYYQDKQKEEEKVRSIYHDLKNHLLILQSQVGNSQDVQNSVAELEEQIEGYANYYHTGNDFLDIIIRDKAKIAQEKQIDFSVVIHFEEGSFIEPLDISTIFGNALDNAIEASEKLPVDKRMITVKAACIRDMLIITVENNRCNEQKFKNKTTKEDKFLHGFGLSNIKKAVAKYGGTYTVNAESNIFKLKIVIPVFE